MVKVHIPIQLEAHPLVDLGRTCLLKQEQGGYFAFLHQEILVRQQNKLERTYPHVIGEHVTCLKRYCPL